MSSDTSKSQPKSSSKGSNPNAPTVLHLVSRLDGGGGSRLAIDLATALVEAGGRGLIAFDGEASTYELTKHRITPVAEALTARNPISSYNVTRRLAQTIREQKVDLVHTQNATLAAVGQAAAHKA